MLNETKTIDQNDNDDEKLKEGVLKDENYLNIHPFVFTLRELDEPLCLASFSKQKPKAFCPFERGSVDKSSSSILF